MLQEWHTNTLERWASLLFPPGSILYRRVCLCVCVCVHAFCWGADVHAASSSTLSWWHLGCWAFAVSWAGSLSHWWGLLNWWLLSEPSSSSSSRGLLALYVTMATAAGTLKSEWKAPRVATFPVDQQRIQTLGERRGTRNSPESCLCSTSSVLLVSVLTVSPCNVSLLSQARGSSHWDHQERNPRCWLWSQIHR